MGEDDKKRLLKRVKTDEKRGSAKRALSPAACFKKSPSNFPQSLYCKHLSLRVHAHAGKDRQGKEHTQQ